MMLQSIIVKKQAGRVAVVVFLLAIALTGVCQQSWAAETAEGTLSVGVSAQSAAVPKLGMNDVSAQAGQSCNVDVRITGNPGILGATLEVAYDSRLTLTGIANGAAFKSLDMTKPGTLQSGCKVHWDAAEIADGDVKDGVIATLTFKVPESASAGTAYSISVASAVIDGKTDVYDRDLASVDLQPTSCRIIALASVPAHTVHTYGAWSTAAEPTCEKAGKREKSCSACGDTVAEVIPALGHKWNSGKVIKAATYDVTGIREFTCEICHESRTEAIPKLNRVSLDNASIGAIGIMTYTGEALVPSLTVKTGGKALVKDKDYTVACENNENVGTATVTIVGKGGYSGSKTATFKIAAAKNKITVSKKSLKKRLKAKSLKKSAKTIAPPKVTPKFGNATWKVTKKDKKKVLSLKNGKVTVKKSAKKGTYTMKLKATVAKTNNYSAANSKVVTVKVTVK